MPVVKRADSQNMPRPALVLDLGDLRREAEALEAATRANIAAMLEEARAERARIVAGAREEGLKSGHAEGYRKGHEEGRAAGRAEAIAQTSARLGELATALSAVLDAFTAAREELLLSARAEVLAFAVAAAERVTRRVIAIDPGVVAGQLEAALAMTVAPSRLFVRVHPDDEALAREILPTLVERFAPGAHAVLSPDSTLARGSALIRTELGEVDASIDTQLDRIIEAVLPGQPRPSGPAAPPSAPPPSSPPAPPAGEPAA
ncbi:MAG: FliH/SctL family protein [Planctomycetota bacterium]|nr:FliH/SctL family protein [Planctomycetota bacterium]